MAIDINIPSQVKNYANLAGFPATGTLKTIFIAEDTNKTYRWTGSAYVEISASQAASWGTITGTLSTQTDLQTALNGKVPTTRTLTINGTTQDLSADRTFTVSTGITIGTTAITSGTNGRFLFDDGGVVSETNGAFWDKVNGRFGLGTSSPSRPLHVVGASLFNNLIFNDTSATTVHTNIEVKSDNAYETGLLLRSTTGLRWQIYVNNYTSNNFIFYNYKLGAQAMMIAGGTSNVLINTTTDAGYKLDVNGTARVQNTLTVSAGGAVITGQVQANGGLKTTVVLNNTFNTNSNSRTIFQSSDALGEARFYQSVCAGYVATINTSAVLQAESTTQGFLPPRMTTTQRNAIASPAPGLVVYDNTDNKHYGYNGTTWNAFY